MIIILVDFKIDYFHNYDSAFDKPENSLDFLGKKIIIALITVTSKNSYID